MDLGILTNKYLPTIFLTVGIGVWLLQYVKFTSSKKVVLEKRRTNTKTGVYRRLQLSIIKKLEKNHTFNSVVEKVQFNLGYYSSDSEKKNKEKAERYVVNTLVQFIIETLFVVMVFKTTLMIKIFIIVVINLIKVFIYNNKINIKKNKLRNDFPLLVKEFITHYVDRLNVVDALQDSTRNMSDVYQVHINRLITQLHTGIDIEKSLLMFDKRIDYIMCSSFVTVLKSAYSSNKNVIPNLLELETLIAQERANSKKYKDKLQEKKSNIYFLSICLIAEIFFMGDYAKTSTGNFFMTTIDGQALLGATFLAIIVALLVSIYLEIV